MLSETWPFCTVLTCGTVYCSPAPNEHSLPEQQTAIKRKKQTKRQTQIERENSPLISRLKGVNVINRVLIQI